MAACPQVKAIYEETIREFTFRNSDGITIPKDVRENAYTLAVDIVIISTRREVYKNYGVTPAEGFYGNATLIMQDMCELKIPVKMPRQRLYYGRVAEAFIYWQALVDWSYLQGYFSALGTDLIPIGNALGISYAPAPYCCSLPDRSWIELPLREVYFNCPSGTQYKIEVSWYKALQITDGCGNIRDPRSKKPDGEKDSGLPPDGSQPNVATNPDNPFSNLPLPTPDSEQGSFSNSKTANVDDTNPAFIPITPNPNSIFWLKITNVTKRPSFPNGCSSNRTTISYIALINGDIRATEVERVGAGGGTGCGTYKVFDIFLTGGTSPLDYIYYDDNGSHSFDYGFSDVLPSDSSVFS